MMASAVKPENVPIGMDVIPVLTQEYTVAVHVHPGRHTASTRLTARGTRKGAWIWG